MPGFLLLGVSMFVLFTDFSLGDPYVGQMKAVLHGLAPGVPVVDGLHDMPDYDTRAGAHLLAALLPEYPAGSIVVAVVDPGVGGPRPAAAVRVDGRWLVGPDNGLLSVAAARGREVARHHVQWHPSRLSASFHGRDLFAPLAAMLATGTVPEGGLSAISELAVELGPADLGEVIYVDHYGNALTGLRAASLGADTRLRAGGRLLSRARVFAEAQAGEPFWYENSIGLVEVAVPCGSAAQALGLVPGTVVGVEGR